MCEPMALTACLERIEPSAGLIGSYSLGLRIIQTTSQIRIANGANTTTSITPMISSSNSPGAPNIAAFSPVQLGFITLLRFYSAGHLSAQKGAIAPHFANFGDANTLTGTVGRPSLLLAG